MNKLGFVFPVLGLCLSGGTARASGFLLNEFDAEAVGRGEASTATDVEASSIYYNVGGLAVLPGASVMVGGSLIAPSSSFTQTGTDTKVNSTTSPQAIPGIFASYRIIDLLAIGVGFYTPYGLTINWPAPPQTNPEANIATSVSLASYYITPSVGLNLNKYVPGLAVGAGLDIVPATIQLQQAIYFGADTAGNANLGAQAVGVGARVGAMYRPQFLPRLSVGVAWHSNVTESFTGSGNFESPPQYRQMLPANGDVSTTLNLPASVSGGVAYRPIDTLELEADVSWTEWSKLQSLNITVPSVPLEYMANGTTQVMSTPENYKNTTSVRVGGEYVLTNIGLSLRAGYIYDPTPVPSTTLTAILPDTNRNDICLGASKWLGEYAVHLGLLYVLPSSRETSSIPYTPEYKGTFDLSAFVATVSATGRWR